MAIAEAVIDDRADRWVVATWIGAAVMGAALLVASVFTALSTAAVVIVSGALVLASLSSARVRHAWVDFLARRSRAWVGGGVLLVTMGALLTRPVTLHDTGAYHQGVIEWLTSYGTVPGVALVHPRLAFNSTWFALDTPFNSGFLHARTAGLLGGFAVLLGVLHLTVAARRWILGRRRLADVFLVVGLAAVVLSIPSDLLNSPSPDVPVALLIVESVCLLLRAVDAPASTRRQLATAAVMLASATVGIKLTALPIAILCMFVAFVLVRSPRGRIALGLVAVVFVAPTLVSNTIGSGCPAFPSQPCLDVEWRLSSDETAQVRRDSFEFERHEATERATPSFIWREWFLVGGSTRSTLALLALAVAGLAVSFLVLRSLRLPAVPIIGLLALLLLVVILSRRLPVVLIFSAAVLAGIAVVIARSPGVRVVGVIGVLGLGFVLYVGPFTRFALGYVAISVAAFAAAASSRLDASAWRRQGLGARAPRRARAVAIGVVAVAVPIAALVYVPGFGKGSVVEDPERAFLPEELADAPVERRRAGDVVYDLALEEKRCWASELPCAELPLPDDRRLRDPDEGIAGGFTRAR